MTIECFALILSSGDHDHQKPPSGPNPWRPEIVLASTGYE